MEGLGPCEATLCYTVRRSERYQAVDMGLWPSLRPLRSCPVCCSAGTWTYDLSMFLILAMALLKVLFVLKK